MSNSDTLAPDHPLIQAGWTAQDDDGTFVASISKLYLRRVGDRTELALQTDERHKNLSGFVHGGVIMTMMDRAMGMNCRQAAGGRAVTMTITVNFVGPVRPGDFIRMSSSVTKVGRSVIFAKGEAYVGDRVVATASCVCKLVKPVK